MKKLKFLITLCLLTLVVSAATATVGTIVQREKTGEEAAHGFVINDNVSEFRGRFEFTRLFGKSDDRIVGNFAMNNSQEITWLVVNGDIIVGPADRPLRTLPVNTLGITYKFSFQIEAIGEKGEPVRFGYFYAEELTWGQPINITWHVIWESKYMPYSAKETQNLRMETRGKYSGSDTFYDSKTGGFSYSVDPSENQWDYKIYDSGTGFIYETGSIAFDGSKQQDPSHAINQSFEEGVTPFRIGSYFSGQKFRSSAYREGKEIPAAVYFGRTDREFFVIAEGLLAGSRIEARALNPLSNELELVASTTVETVPTKGFGATILSVPIGKPHKVIITVLGGINPDWRNGFYLNISDWDPTGGGHGEGGKAGGDVGAPFWDK